MTVNHLVPDADPISIKVCKTGFRIMRGRGPNRPYLWVRHSEVTNLTNTLIDLYEKSDKP